MNRTLLFATMLILSGNPTVHAQVINTVAGNGQAGYGGDGGPATTANLNRPFNVAVDNDDNLFIADRVNQRIRKVDKSGTITTVAGNGTPGYSGDGNAATNAQLNDPTSIATDGQGDLYIADHANHCIRKVSNSGIITTIAGNGNPGYSGDGGLATAAELSGPRGVAIDRRGNLFIADAGNHCVRKVSLDGIITTIAGNGIASFGGDGEAATAASLHGPYCIATDYSDNVYIADVDNERIRKVDRNGTISTVAGNGQAAYSGDGGPATAAALNEPIGVAVSRSGEVFIADGWNNRVRMVDGRNGNINTIAGNGTAGFNGDNIACTIAELNAPYGVTVDNGDNVYIADYNNNRIRKLTRPPISASSLELIIFPNPASASFAIKAATGKKDKVAVVATDLMGRQVFETTIEPNYITDVHTGLPTGAYYLKATCNDLQAFSTLVIVH